jgi:hypothetical protein
MMHVSQFRNGNLMQIVKNFMIVFLIVFVSAGCRNIERSEDQHFEKFDAPLRIVISDREDTNPDRLIHILIELTSAPDDNLSKFFNENDIEITATSGNILAAYGKASDIRKIAGSEAVVSVSLSEERGLHR